MLKTEGGGDCGWLVGKACNMDIGSLSCGPFQIKNPSWIDCINPGGGELKIVFFTT